MTSQRKVKEYLEKNKISPLFEDLMAKLMHTMPTDPLSYLVTVLERKIQKKKQQAQTLALSGENMSLRKSTGNLISPSAGDVSAWTVGGSGGIVSKESKDVRGYERPWTSSAKSKPPLRTVDTSPTATRRSTRTDKSPARKSTGTRVAWNPDTKTATGDFDELWQLKQTKPAPSPAPKQSLSPTRRHKRVMALEDLEMTFTSHGYTGPRRPRTSQDEEFSPATTPAETEEMETGQRVARFGKRRQKPSACKQELHQLLEVERRDSGLEEEADIDDQEDGTEIYEDEDELKREGVSSVKSTGLRMKGSRSAGDKGPTVRVSICGRCARVMTAGSEPVSRRTAFTDSPTSYDQSSVQFTSAIDDDEFESVSQVSGPRRPVWIEEDKVSDPLKGSRTSMLASGGVPHKGQPMYPLSSPEITPDTEDLSPSPPQVSWNEITEQESPPSIESPAPLASARAWDTPADSDITDWEPERVRRARAQNGNGRY